MPSSNLIIKIIKESKPAFLPNPRVNCLTTHLNKKKPLKANDIQLKYLANQSIQTKDAVNRKNSFGR